MKMTTEHYETLKLAIAKVSHKAPEHREVLLRQDKYKQSLERLNKRVRWDCYWAAQEYLPERFVINTLYEYLNDDHIDTALKKIQRELSL